VFVLITHLTSGTTDPTRKLTCDKMADGDDDRDCKTSSSYVYYSHQLVRVVSKSPTTATENADQ